MGDIMCDNKNENQKFICNLVVKDNQYSFFIPSYQRGYRWTEQEVKALLEDINELEENNKYCIQPLIVKKILHENKTKYEVVDGQQRLTTILNNLRFNNLFC